MDTPTSPVTSGLPLFFVITVTAIKQVRTISSLSTSLSHSRTAFSPFHTRTSLTSVESEYAFRIRIFLDPMSSPYCCLTDYFCFFDLYLDLDFWGFNWLLPSTRSSQTWIKRILKIHAVLKVIRRLVFLFSFSFCEVCVLAVTKNSAPQLPGL